MHPYIKRQRCLLLFGPNDSGIRLNYYDPKKVFLLNLNLINLGWALEMD